MTGRRGLWFGFLAVLTGIVHIAYGTFCVAMNYTPEEAYYGYRILDNGDEDRWLGIGAVILGSLVFWFGLHIISKVRREHAVHSD